MKQIFKLFIIFLCIISFSLNVNAGAGYSGDGKKFVGDGTGTGGPCNGGYCLQLSAMIKFTLVDVSGNKLKPLGQYLMQNTALKDYIDFFKNSNEDGNQHIRGMILSNGSYSYSAYDIGHYVKVDSFSNMSDIISINQGLNFDSEALKKKIIKNSGSCNTASTNCLITDEYKKLILRVLKDKRIIRNEVTDLKDETLTLEEKSAISKLRMFVEPIYTFKKGGKDTHIFATTKAAAIMIPDKYIYDNVLGTNVWNLYHNLTAPEKAGNVLNKDGFIDYRTSTALKQITALRNPNNGAGYAVVKLAYNISESNKCTIQKKDGKYIFYDALDAGYSDAPENFEYFLNQCGCSALNSVPEELKNKYSDIYSKFSDTCIERRCKHIEDNGNYTFYKKNAKKTTEYSAYIKSCGCTHPNVTSLKEKFSTIYDSECPPPFMPPPEAKVKSNLKACTANEATENYEIEKNDTKAINTYCYLNCKETINFNDVYGKYTVKAGKYFELGKYPTLTAKKNCEVTVNYNRDSESWLSKYNKLGNDQALYLSEYNEHKAVENPSVGSEFCYCPSEAPCVYEPVYSASYTTYTFSNGEFASSTKNLSWGGCDNNPKPYTNKYAKVQFEETIGRAEQLFNDLKTCSIYLSMLDGTTKTDRETTKDKYYEFTGDLKYYYYQDYSKLGTKRNDERSKNVDDSDMKAELKQSIEDGNYKDYSKDNKTYNYFSGFNVSSNKKVGLSDYSNNINRIVELKYEYLPEIFKSVDIFTATILDTPADNINKVELKNVYDTDYSVVSKSDNDNYFQFTSLGDDNEIYDWFKKGKEVEINGINKNATINDTINSDLNRACKYEITNDLIKCSPDNCKLNVIYRSVDPYNIDPNNRLKDSNKGFENWKTTNAQVVKKKIEDDGKVKNTYSPDNLEYSFVLDSTTIAAIREENKTYKYDDWNDSLYKCVEGNNCESVFITKLKDNKLKDIFNREIKNVLKNYNGRNTWKEIKDIGGNKYTIDGKEVELNS